MVYGNVLPEYKVRISGFTSNKPLFWATTASTVASPRIESRSRFEIRCKKTYDSIQHHRIQLPVYSYLLI